MKKRIASFVYAWRGVREYIALGTNAKIQLAAGVVAVVGGVVLGLTTTEWLAVTICIGFVLSAEAMNTALEELANEVTEERRERIRRVKDMAAGAVLIASITALAVAAIILAARL